MAEAGHVFLARMGKTTLRPGGIDATAWLIAQAGLKPDTRILEVACNMGRTMIQLAELRLRHHRRRLRPRRAGPRPPQYRQTPP